MIGVLLLCSTAVWGQTALKPAAVSKPSSGISSPENPDRPKNPESPETPKDNMNRDAIVARGDTTVVSRDTIVTSGDTTIVREETIAVSGDSTEVRGDSTEMSGQPQAERGQVKTSNSLAGPVHYQSSDSMIMMGNGTAFLHGNGDLKYQTMQLTSDYIKMNMDSNQIYARGVWDSLEYEWKGKPVFKEGSESYETSEITYNIKTQKGYIRRVVTQNGEGYIVADRTKKMEGDEMMMAGGEYTTCDNHDHPHFYLKLTKAKVKPGEYIATGPAYLVVGDVPLPLAIPFGFFPFTNSYSSGLIMPTFGDDYTRGMNLQGLGYYFALCDYLDLEVKGDIYTRGTWAINATSKYIWRYHFSGNLSVKYRNDVTSERGLPDYAVNKNFSVTWSHSQDSKLNPYSTFSASVNFSTSGYDRSNINNYYNAEAYSTNTKSSNISYQQRFPDSPWSLSMSASLSQSTRDSTLSLTAPELAVTMSSVYPFKLLRQAVLKKNGKPAGKERWYEKIKISYSGNGRIAINNVKEREFLHTNFLRDWKTGLRHTMPINASFTLFKYLNVTPTINLRDRMYFQSVDRRWNDETQALEMDTTNGFYNVFDFDVGLSMSTKLYGFYTPLKKLFPNSKVEKFRHVLTPTLSVSYHPDFQKEMWGYYGSYDQPIYTNEVDSVSGRKIQKTDENGHLMFQHQTYSRFPNGIYGNALTGLSATLSFGVQNNLEVKVVNKEDTTGKNPYKVISLIDNFGVTGGYNFAADSMNWSQFNVNLRLKFPKLNNYSLNLNTSLDPYMYELDASGRPRRTNKQYWHNGRFPHWSGLRWSFNYTLNNQTIKKWKEKIEGRKPKDENSQEPPPEETGGSSSESYNLMSMERGDDGTMNNAKLSSGNKRKEPESEDGYEKVEIPWSLSISYSLAYAQGNEFDYDKMYYKMKFSNFLTLNGNIGLGRGWKVSASMTYNFDDMKVTSCTFNISRDLHCWNMTASINPIGAYKSYAFHIGVNASMLRDLKYDKNSNSSTNARVNWW